MVDLPASASLREAALWYARAGLPVFPLRPRGKEPLTPHGFHDATTDPAQVEEWWSRWPDANIGLDLGRAGLFVLDADPRNGGPADRFGLIELLGPLPDTAEAATGGGGRHVYFRSVNGIRCGLLAAGIDIKAAGGYVVLPPSIHPSGQAYEWDGIAGANALLKPADPPVWLLERLARGHGCRAASAKRSGTPRIMAGSRNSKLTSVAGALRRQGMGEEAIAAALLAINEDQCEPPLSGDEVRRIAHSVARYPAPADRDDEPDDLEVIRRALNRLPVAQVRKIGQKRAEFDLVLDDGTTIELGPAADVLNPRRVQAAIADAAAVVIPTSSRKDWEGVAAAIFRCAGQGEEAGDFTTEIRSWLARFVYDHPVARVSMADPEELADAITNRLGMALFEIDGRLAIRLTEFLREVQMVFGYRTTATELGRRLRRMGFTAQQVSARKGDTVAKARLWFVPPGLDLEMVD